MLDNGKESPEMLWPPLPLQIRLHRQLDGVVAEEVVGGEDVHALPPVLEEAHRQLVVHRLRHRPHAVVLVAQQAEEARRQGAHQRDDAGVVCLRPDVQRVDEEVPSIAFLAGVAHEDALVRGRQLAHRLAETELHGNDKGGEVVEDEALDDGVSAVHLALPLLEALLEAVKVEDDDLLGGRQEEGEHLFEDLCQ
ncbi:hypothetical protein TYRP_003319 [Tyrophagus putrescentiae]|nr:hypothetical protein TYRP_003319 [Tyrophagus putrescentiae]